MYSGRVLGPSFLYMASQCLLHRRIGPISSRAGENPLHANQKGMEQIDRSSEADPSTMELGHISYRDCGHHRAVPGLEAAIHSLAREIDSRTRESFTITSATARQVTTIRLPSQPISIDRLTHPKRARGSAHVELSRSERRIGSHNRPLRLLVEKNLDNHLPFQSQASSRMFISVMLNCMRIARLGTVHAQSRTRVHV